MSVTNFDAFCQMRSGRLDAQKRESGHINIAPGDVCLTVEPNQTLSVGNGMHPGSHRYEVEGFPWP